MPDGIAYALRIEQSAHRIAQGVVALCLHTLAHVLGEAGTKKDVSVSFVKHCAQGYSCLIMQQRYKKGHYDL
jgi:hypothetical protein